MKNHRNIVTGLVIAAAAAFFAACAAGPPPQEIAAARLAIQEAKNSGADQRAPRQYDAAVAHLNVAQNSWDQAKDAQAAAHWARLAEGEARDAQYRAETAALEEELRRERDRKARGELAVRDAEIAMLQGAARAEAEKRAAEAEARAREEAEARAREERARLEDELARRDAANREAEARLAAERERAEREAAQRSQAEKDRVAAELERMRMELEETRAAAEEARKAAEAERLKLEEQRRADEARMAEMERLRQEQEKTREELRATLSRLAQVREEAGKLIVTLPGSIYFDVNKSDVKPAMRARLTEIAKALAAVPEQRVLIEGHTDADGSNEYNLKLSQLRAESVRSVLLAGGVTPGRLEAHGYGETKPVASNTTAAGKSQNRRVELVLEGSAAAPR
jgi:outer membrane protein OmpA-like peptidoglycan-associated protein